MNMSKIRLQINAIDDQLLALLEERMELVRAIGEIKRQSGTAIYRPDREREILDRLGAHKGVLTKSAIEAIFLEIFAVSRHLELAEKIAFLGPVGSFSHQAAESRFGAFGEYLAMQTIAAVFNAVEAGRAKYGVVPIANNVSGLVGDTIDKLETSSLLIASDMELPIHHAFASRAESLNAIKRVYSKDVAFCQCRAFFAEHLLETLDYIPVESTTKAAQLASADHEAAAVCSHIAAKLHDLPVLFENIEDSGENRTRFAILSDFQNPASGKDKTTILAQTPNKAGALFLLLKEFNDAAINLTKLDSRPSKGDESRSQFFIDFDGHRDDPAVAAILERRKDTIKWLGSYAKTC
ncbi:chorismate mutase [Campylobacterota bacterium]|nr:chorismate mutase [Campylobacterota bacterium]